MSRSAFLHTNYQFPLLNLSSFNPPAWSQPMHLYPLLRKQHQSRAQIQLTGDLMTWSDDRRVLEMVSKHYSRTMFCDSVLVYGSKALCQPAGAGCEICLLSLNWLGKYESRWSVDLVICLHFVLNFNTEIKEMKWGCVCWCNKCAARCQTVPWVLRMSKVIWEL